MQYHVDKVKETQKSSVAVTQWKFKKKVVCSFICHGQSKA